MRNSERRAQAALRFWPVIGLLLGLAGCAAEKPAPADYKARLDALEAEIETLREDLDRDGAQGSAAAAEDLPPGGPEWAGQPAPVHQKRGGLIPLSRERGATALQPQSKPLRLKRMPKIIESADGRPQAEDAGAPPSEAEEGAPLPDDDATAPAEPAPN